MLKKRINTGKEIIHPEMKKESETLSEKTMDGFNLGSDHINIRTSNLVRLNENFAIMTSDGPIDLNVEIIADFAKIPPVYHEIFLNMLTSKYLNKVSFSDNPFSECRFSKKKNWWERLKERYK